MSLRAVELSNSCLGRPAFVPVMQPANFGDRDDAARFGELYSAWIRRILFQCEVRAGPVIQPVNTKPIMLNSARSIIRGTRGLAGRYGYTAK